MFKFKDLYVTLTSETSEAGHPQNVAYYDAARPITLGSGKCAGPVGTTPCCDENQSMVAVFPFQEAADLKKSLAEQLGKNEMKKVPVLESASLETVAEVEALEQKLNGALGELKNRKAQLQKKLAATK